MAIGEILNYLGISQWLWGKISGGINYLKDSALSVFNTVGNFVVSAGNTIEGAVTSAVNSAGKTIGGAANNFVHSFGELISGFHFSYSKIIGGSNVTMLLTDPSGKRLGASIDSGKLTEYREIPDGLYSGNQSEPQTFVIHEPMLGVYKLHVAVRESGDFHLTFQLIQNWNVVNSTNLLKTLPTGAYDYELTYGAVGNSCCLFIGEPTSALPAWFWPLMVVISGIGSGLAVGLFMRRGRRTSTAVTKS